MRWSCASCFAGCVQAPRPKWVKAGTFVTDDVQVWYCGGVLVRQVIEQLDKPVAEPVIVETALAPVTPEKETTTTTAPKSSSNGRKLPTPLALIPEDEDCAGICPMSPLSSTLLQHGVVIEDPDQQFLSPKSGKFKRQRTDTGGSGLSPKSTTSRQSKRSSFSGKSSQSLTRLKRALSKTLGIRKDQSRLNFHGKWICTDTWGLEDFLKKNGASFIQRKTAMAAKWPSWEYTQDGDKFSFLNHTMMGDLREEFTADGSDYTCIDGRGTQHKCKSYWEEDKLITEKTCSEGSIREQRYIDDQGFLHFELAGTGAKAGNGSWGRTFKRG